MEPTGRAGSGWQGESLLGVRSRQSCFLCRHRDRGWSARGVKACFRCTGRPGPRERWIKSRTVHGDALLPKSGSGLTGTSVAPPLLSLSITCGMGEAGSSRPRLTPFAGRTSRSFCLLSLKQRPVGLPSPQGILSCSLGNTVIPPWATSREVTTENCHC